MPARYDRDRAARPAHSRSFTFLAALMLCGCAAPAKRPSDGLAAPGDSVPVSELLRTASAAPTEADDPSAPRIERLSMSQAIPGATHLRGVSWKSGGDSEAPLSEALGLPHEPVLAAFYSQRRQLSGKESVPLPFWTPVAPAAPEEEEGKKAASTAEAASSTPAAAPATEAALAAPAVAEHPDGPEWIVNVATYADVDLARQHAQRLITEGFKAAVREEKVRGRSSYRVVIESLSTESAAQSALTHLTDRYGERTAWAMRKR